MNTPTAKTDKPSKPLPVELREKVLQALELVSAGEPATKSAKAVGLSNGSFYRALEGDTDLQRAYHLAAQLRAEALADEIVEIADTDPDPHRAKNRMWARTWTASKLRPSRYGEKVMVDVGGSISLRAILDTAEKRRAMLLRDHGEVIDLPALPGEQPGGLDDLLS